MLSSGCLSCSTNDKFSFCYNSIRMGAIAHIGAVSESPSGNPIWIKTLNNMYYKDLPVGQAFVKDYADYQQWIITLTGDPTLDLNPPTLLDKPLPLPWSLSQ